MSRRFDFNPKEPVAELKTVQSLKSWMEENGCNFLSYEIDSARIAEGHILAPVGSSYHWIYTERGVESVVKRFDNESDAVFFAYNQIKVDGWAWSLMVGFVSEMEELNALKNCLTKKKIPFYEDSIPYGGKDDLRYRVYVHGSHANAVSDLKERFGSFARIAARQSEPKVT
jgi:hypothetical protein